MKKTMILALASSIAISSSAFAEVKALDSPCSDLRLSIKQQISEDSDQLLEIIRTEIAANEDCACEIVKTAIASTDPSAKEVAAIVEVAITTAPEKASLIAQCAVAVAPDAIEEIQGVLAKFDKNAGETAPSGKYSAKDSPKDIDKGGIAPRQASSPLDFPQGPNGGGTPEVSLPPFFLPPVAPPTIGVTPPDLTFVNPQRGDNLMNGGDLDMNGSAGDMYEIRSDVPE